MSTSLGLIETFGLVAAITAADAASKSANVRLLDYELTKGKGLVTVKFVGDVGAVEAALNAAVAATERIGKVYSKLVIPRPSDQLETILKKKEMADEVDIAKGQEENTNTVTKTGTEIKQDERESVDSYKENLETEIADDCNLEKQEQVDLEEQGQSESEATDDVCNLCHDPVCPRRKGDLRTLCIHYNE